MLNASKTNSNPLTLHEELLVSDLGRQKRWTLILYLSVGVLALGFGFLSESPPAKLLCAGGGFLTALSIEKAVTQKIRTIALKLYDLQKNGDRQTSDSR